MGDYGECRDLLTRWAEAGAKEICVWPLLDPVRQFQLLGQLLALLGSTSCQDNVNPHRVIRRLPPLPGNKGTGGYE